MVILFYKHTNSLARNVTVSACCQVKARSIVDIIISLVTREGHLYVLMYLRALLKYFDPMYCRLVVCC